MDKDIIPAKPLQDSILKWYQRAWVAVLMLFLFAPVGIFLMWRYHKWNKRLKIILTGVFSLMFFVSYIGSGDGTSNATGGGRRSAFVDTRENPSEHVRLELGDRFICEHGLEHVIGNEIIWSSSENPLASYETGNIFRVPISVTNPHGSHSPYWGLRNITGNIINPSGNFVGPAVRTNDIIEFILNASANRNAFTDEIHAQLRSGATYHTYVFVHYEGDGDYILAYAPHNRRIASTFAIYIPVVRP